MAARRTGLVIRRAELRDAEALCAVFGSPRAQAGTLQMPMPSVEFWRKRIDAQSPPMTTSRGRGRWRVVGNAGLHSARTRASAPRASVGMSVRDDWQGKGVGRALMARVVDLADNWFDYRRLELTVYVDNPAALALYQRFGFEIEGTLREYAFRNGPSSMPTRWHGCAFRRSPRRVADRARRRAQADQDGAKTLAPACPHGSTEYEYTNIGAIEMRNSNRRLARHGGLGPHAAHDGRAGLRPLSSPRSFRLPRRAARAPTWARGAAPLQDASDVAALARHDVIITCQGGDWTTEMHPKLRAAGLERLLHRRGQDAAHEGRRRHHPRPREPQGDRRGARARRARTTSAATAP